MEAGLGQASTDPCTAPGALKILKGSTAGAAEDSTHFLFDINGYLRFSGP